MIARVGFVLMLALTLGVTSASGQERVEQSDSMAVRADAESRFGASFLLGTLGSAAGLFVGGAGGLGLAGDDEGGFNEFHGLGQMILGAAIGSTIGSGLAAGAGEGKIDWWPVLGGAIGCVAGVFVLSKLDVSEAQALVYFPIQGLVAAAFAQIGR